MYSFRVSLVSSSKMNDLLGSIVALSFTLLLTRLRGMIEKTLLSLGRRLLRKVWKVLPKRNMGK